MAATGLLGINPYQKGVALDISSKPINLAIQLEQKEAIKRDALDKYYMDYEKSINPAGMRGQDQDVFLGKLNEAKSYYLQNRDKILNPSKYGAEFQSQYMSHLKGAQGLIEQSKQAAANEKADREHYQRATEQGLDIPDGYLSAVQKSHLPLNHPQYQPLDTYTYNFSKPFDEDVFAKTITRGLTPSISKNIQKPDGKGYIDRTTTYAYTPEDKLTVAKNAGMLYGSNAGVTNKVNKLIKTGEYINFNKEFNDLFPGQDIAQAKPQQIAAAVGLSFTPHGKTISDQIEDKKFWADYHNKLAMRLINANKSNQQNGGTNPPHPSSLIEAITNGNENYTTAIPENKNQYDATEALAGYGLKKLRGFNIGAEKIIYDKPSKKYIISYPKDYGIPDESYTPNALKSVIMVNNPDVSATQKNWGAIAPSKNKNASKLAPLHPMK